MKVGKNVPLAVLNVLVNREDYVTTRELRDIIGCDRKTVYNAVATLETHGFSVDIEHGGKNKANKYKYRGLYGM